MASPVGEAADNQLLMTASSTNIVVDGSVTYVLTVTNSGPSASTNVQVSDSMPSGFTLDPSSSSTVGSITRSGSTVIWNIDVLATNAGGLATLTMQAHTAGNFFNSAFVSATTPDPNPDDDFVSTNITVGVVTPPLLSVVVVNTNGMFQFVITNNGPNQTNVIQASTNLVKWIPIFTNVGSFTFTNAIDPNYPFRFYRDYIPGP
jgi:uncharacterized repeat protein (TIGR01451 family)